jgi:predicted nucleic acid-binding protein
LTFAVARTPVVVDASFAIEAILVGGSPLTILEAWASERRTRLVPPVFWLETANVLVRRRGFEPGRAALAVGALARSGIQAADRGIAGVADAIDLAARHGLTAYDASYLQLALDIDGALATLDRALASAANAEGIEVVREG